MGILAEIALYGIFAIVGIAVAIAAFALGWLALGWIAAKRL